MLCKSFSGHLFSLGCTLWDRARFAKPRVTKVMGLSIRSVLGQILHLEHIPGFFLFFFPSMYNFCVISCLLHWLKHKDVACRFVRQVTAYRKAKPFRSIIRISTTSPLSTPQKWWGSTPTLTSLTRCVSLMSDVYVVIFLLLCFENIRSFWCHNTILVDRIVSHPLFTIAFVDLVWGGWKPAVRVNV